MGQYAKEKRFDYGGGLTVVVELSPELREMQTKFPKESKKACVSALKRLRAPTRTDASKLVRKLYAISAGDSELRSTINETFKVTQSSEGAQATKKYLARRLTSYHFRAGGGNRLKSGKRSAVAMTVFKGRRKKVKGGFMAPTSSSGGPSIIFKRLGASRLPIKAVRTLSVVQMIQHEQVREPLQDTLNEKFQTAFVKDMKRRIGS